MQNTFICYILFHLRSVITYVIILYCFIVRFNLASLSLRHFKFSVCTAFIRHMSHALISENVNTSICSTWNSLTDFTKLPWRPGRMMNANGERW